MNYRERLKLLLRSQLFYFGALIFIVGVVICSNVGENSDVQLPAAILAQGGIIVGFWAYRRTRFIITNPASQVLQKRRFRLELIINVVVVCVGFMLTPAILWSDMTKMHGFVFWYIIATGFVGLLGLVGLFVWLKRGSGL